ncbi:hypothetical protein BVX97_02225 [bacterium E08(2017)]|nr:hypothetical protein BVX97_02225 [bacterium E08(2017)]
MRRWLTYFGIVSICMLSVISSLAASFSVANVTELDAALTVAETNSQDDVIYIQGGTYLASDLGAGPISYLAGTNPVENFSIFLIGTNGTVYIDGNSQQTMSIDTRVTGQSQANAHVFLENLTFQNGFINSMLLAGAGLYVQTQNGNITLTDIYVMSNSASHVFDDPNCAGAYIRSQGVGDVNISRCRFQNNDADGNAGALQLMIGVGGSATVVNNVFYNNKCRARGGAVYASVIGSLTMNHNTYLANTNEGGAAWCNGGGLYVYQPTDTGVATINNNIFWTNTTVNGQGGDVYLENDGNTNFTAAFNVFTGNNYTELGIAINDNLTTNINISADPMFMDQTNGVVNLVSNSPCIDAGSELGYTNDFVLQIRPLDGDDNGNPYPDMGAYEYLHPTADSDGDTMPDTWELSYGLNPSVTSGVDGALGDLDGDGFINVSEYIADTVPTNAASYLAFTDIAASLSSIDLYWQGGSQVTQYIERTYISTNLLWEAVYTNLPPTVTNTVNLAPASNVFYRVRAIR